METELSSKQQAVRGGLPLVLGTITLVQSLLTVAVLALATLAPVAALSLGVGAEAVGYQISIIYTAAALVSSSAGAFVRRWGACSISQAALAFGLAGVLGLTSPNLLLIALASVFIGIGYGLATPASSHLLHRVSPPSRRNLIFSLKQTGVPLGGVIAGLSLPPLTALFGWGNALLFVAIVALLLLIGLAPLRPSWDSGRDPALLARSDLFSGPRLILRSPYLRMLSLMGFCFSATQLSLMTFTVTLLVKDLDWSLIEAGTAASAVQVVGAVARVCWGMIADRLGNGLLILVLIGILTVGGALMVTAITPTWPHLAVVALLAGFGVAAFGWNGVFLAEVARFCPPAQVSTAIGGALMFTFAGVVVGPSIYASLYSAFGSYTTTFGAIAIFPAVGVGFGVLAQLAKKKPMR